MTLGILIVIILGGFVVWVLGGGLVMGRIFRVPFVEGVEWSLRALVILAVIGGIVFGIVSAWRTPL